MAKTLGIRWNPTGRLLDLLVDVMQAAAGSLAPPHRMGNYVQSFGRKGYGRLSVAAVRAIRRSKEKFASIAAEHRISEAMVAKVRARAAYRWVR